MQDSRKTKQQLIDEIVSLRSELANNNSPLRNAFNGAAIGMILVSLEGKFLETNPHFEKLLGYTEDEYKKKHFNDITHPDDFLIGSEKFNDLIRGKTKSVQLEKRYLHKDGHTVYVHVTSTMIYDAQGKPLHLFAQTKDITERKEVEKLLRESERYHRAMLNQLHEDVMVIDKDYIITDMNNSFLVSTGQERDQVVGRKCFEVSHNYDKPCNLMGELCPLKETFETGKSTSCLHEHILDDGSKAWIDLLLSPLYEEDGSFYKVIESARNVSDLLEAQEQNRKLSAATAQSPVSVIITNIDGVIEFVNPKFCEITGYSQSEALGKKPSILKSTMQGSDFYEDLWQTILNGQTWQGEFHNRKKNGDLFWEDATIGPITNETGEITHFIALKEDITKRKLLEVQLAQSQKLEAIGQLAGGIAHDFNNLLTIINGYSSLILDKVVDKEVRKEIEHIAHAGERAGALTQQLLAFSRKQVIQPKVINLNQLISTTKKMLVRIIGEDIQLNIKPGKNIWDIKADPSQIDQIIFNLSVNARDAMPSGGCLDIETSNFKMDKNYASKHLNAVPGNYLLLTISDTGSGMNAETKKRIFEPFFTTKEEGKGTGLGLSTVYGIVKQNKGYIWVYSEPKIGTTFKIYLPAFSGKAKDTLFSKNEEENLRGSENILVVEDDYNVRKLTDDILKNFGYKTFLAADGVEALKILEKNKDIINMIISDVIMPNLGGKDLSSKIRKLYPKLKLIFVSGYTDDAISRSGILEEGAILLQKPFEPKELLLLIRKTLKS